ncbi:MAG: penicillin-binding protein 2 [Flavobacteriaceae bacterium]|nr:penicillin-binding protein 2 [Flavobacteriaceae bacterium]MDG1966163.1 penicillin-binding protein 2 [Flavobacteriaceae bacterium]
MRRFFLPFVTLLTAIVFVGRLISLQLLNSSYKLLSDGNAVIENSIYPERGYIYDRNQKLLVSNQPVYDLMAIPENITLFDTLELSKILGVSKTELKKQIKTAKTFSVKLPSIIVGKISKEHNAVIQEKIWKYQGFFLQKNSVRNYPVPIASNLLGYVSEVNKNDMKRDNYYRLGELIGRQGIEEYYESFLRGRKGKKFFQKDRFNRIIGSYEEGKYDVPKEGAQNLILTIDSELQRYGEELLKNKRGGIVAIEPRTGEVLSLVSAPSYDPSILVGRKRSKNYRKLALDTLAKPLFDRGLQAQYAPGSPFKTINALVALQEGVIDDKTDYLCQKGHYYARGMFMECHCRPGTKNNLLSGIYRSCNTYFANTYRRIIDRAGENVGEGMNIWNSHLKSFGLGNYLGYDLPVGKKGFIPDADYYNYWYKKGGWKSATVVSNAIGQGELLTTPIQMANFTAAIANRGYYIQPHFLKSVNNGVLDKVYEKKTTSIDSIHFEKVIEGMFQVVERGTAKVAKISGVEVCGKTGTVENFMKIDGVKTQMTDHSIFIAFAPKDDPKIALAVYVENGYWGARWAAPIASLMIEKYLNGSVKRKWLEDRMLNGSLLAEYEKPYLGKPFVINE